jgi:hypothetical protein
MGFIFGASLVLAGLTDPDKIIGALRLKDFQLNGCCFCACCNARNPDSDLFGAANFDVKPV